LYTTTKASMSSAIFSILERLFKTGPSSSSHISCKCLRFSLYKAKFLSYSIIEAGPGCRRDANSAFVCSFRSSRSSPQHLRPVLCHVRQSEKTFWTALWEFQRHCHTNVNCGKVGGAPVQTSMSTACSSFSLWQHI